MLLSQIYPVLSWSVFVVVIGFALIMGVRLLLSFADPNPFGTLGKLAYQLRRATERFVQPFATFLFMWGIDKRYAPILSVLSFAICAYFGLQIIGNALFVIDGIAHFSALGNISAVIGFVLYGLISLYILLIFVRFISSWFVYSRNTFFAFVAKVTDPILLPMKRLIPPVGLFDFSAMILLVVLQILQGIILRVFV